MNRLRDFFSSLQDSFSQRGGSGSSVVLVSIVVLVLAVVLGSAIYFLYLTSARGRLASLARERTPRARRGSWLVRVAVLVLLVASFVAVRHYVIEAPSGCDTCHTDKKQAKALEESPHKGITCAACHRPVGITGSAEEFVTYARWNYTYARTKQAKNLRPGSVDSGACLRCHEDILSAVKERGGIRVRHKDFLNEGWLCRDCHNSISHPTAVTEPSSPSMDKCVLCHDGKQASSECKTCHSEDLTGAGFTPDKLPKVRGDIATQRQSCYVCHDRRGCERCHGTTMPHPVGWGPSTTPDKTAGSHPRAGFTERQICWRCHNTPGKAFVGSNDSCKPCHTGLPGRLHGGSTWVKEHGQQATGQKPGEYSACFDCHSAGVFCELCHPASIDANYHPVDGPDNYPLETPRDPETVRQSSGR